MLEKLLAKIMDMLFAKYFNGLSDELHEINNRLTRIEINQRVNLTTWPGVDILSPKQPNCTLCGGALPCFNSHVTC